MSAFAWIKGKLLTVMAGIGAVLLIVIGLLRVRNADLKTKAAQRERDTAKAAEKTNKKATEAMVKGVINEQSKEPDPAKYDFTK